MKRVVIDTNVLISFLTDRNAEQQLLADNLFHLAERGELEIILHQAIIGEMVYVLSNLYQLPPREVADLVRSLLTTPGVRSVHEVEWKRVLDVWPETFPHLADAILASWARGGKSREIATFDRRFSRTLGRLGYEPYWQA